MRKATVVFAAVLLVVLVITGCGLGPKTTGTIEFALGNSIGSKAIMPGISLEVSGYHVHGLGISGQAASGTFDIDIGVSGVGSIDVLPGMWTLTVTAMNEDDPPVAVGSATGDVPVVVGGSQTAHFDILPYTGAGTFNAVFSWIPDIIVSPSVEVELLKPGTPDVVTPVTMTQPGTMPAGIPEGIPINCVRTGTTSLEQGWYVGFSRVLDNGVMSAGIVRTVRLAAGASTTWLEHLTVAQLQGILTFDFSWDPGRPLTVTSDQDYEIALYNGEDKTVTASCADADGPIVFAWYLNGILTAVSNEDHRHLAAADYMAGTMNYLSCIAWQVDGKRAGDVQHKITRVDIDPALIEIAGTVTNVHNVVMCVRLYTAAGLLFRQTANSSLSSVPFDFTALPAGNYYLAQYAAPNYFVWWNAAQGTDPDPVAAGATLISIPLASAQTFTFGDHLP